MGRETLFPTGAHIPATGSGRGFFLPPHVRRKDPQVAEMNTKTSGKYKKVHMFTNSDIFGHFYAF